jgi:sortase A
MSQGHKSRKVLLWIERILIALGAIALGWYGMVKVQSYLFQQREREQLSRPPAQNQPKIFSPSEGDLVGQLDIPRLGLSTVVVEGTDEKTLQLGAGHVTGTPLPGQKGNTTIAGHRDTDFRPLRNIKKGDQIQIKTPYGSYTYAVEWTKIVKPTHVEVMDPTPSPALTLVTCYPFYYIGSAPDRFIVRAHRIEQTQEVRPQNASTEAPATQEDKDQGWWHGFRARALESFNSLGR